MYIENGRHARLQSQCQRVLLTRLEVPNKGVKYCPENDNESRDMSTMARSLAHNQLRK